MKNRTAAVLLAFILTLVLLPATAAAAETSGTCGRYAKWTLNNGTLTVSGSDHMYDYSYATDVPWYSQRATVKKVVVQGVGSIGDNSFRDCVNLTDVTIGDSVTDIGNYAFQSCASLTSITIPGSVSRICYSAFRECTGLTSLTLQSGVNRIDDYAFYQCTSLTGVTLPNGLKNIGNYAFYQCGSLKEITLPNGLTSIGNDAFHQCGSLTKVTISSSVTSIGNGAFYQCKKLTGLTIPFNVSRIGDSTFEDCTGLTSITIPGSVSSIGNNAFSGCSGLTRLTIENGVTSINYSAFAKCSKLTSVTIPGSVTRLDGGSFEKCSNLTSAVIEDGVTVIPGSMFYECTNLKNVTIPTSVNRIGGYAFESCGVLSDVYYAGSEAQWNNIKIDGYSTNGNNSRLYLAAKHYNSVSGPQVSLAAPAVKLSSASVTEGTAVTVSWDAIPGAYSYHLTVLDGNDDDIVILASHLHGSTTLTISKDTNKELAPGRYRIEVYATDADGNEGPVGSAALTVTKKTETSGKTVTVTFNANGGSVSPKSATATSGQTYGELPVPTRSGYRFDGWYTTKTGSTKITSSTKVTKTVNHTIYAHWSKIRTFSVTLDANGGSVLDEYRSVTIGSRYRSLPTPVRSGYHFSGWYTAKTGGTKITAATQVKSGVTALYARWTKTNPTVKSRQTKSCKIVIPAEYKVLLYKNETTAAQTKTAAAQTGEYTVTCTKTATLSNGTVRYYGKFPKVSSSASYWFTYTDEMFIN